VGMGGRTEPLGCSGTGEGRVLKGSCGGAANENELEVNECLHKRGTTMCTYDGLVGVCPKMTGLLSGRLDGGVTELEKSR
jgi:hypothetical protein